MKICFIIGTLRFSGAEKVLTALASHLSQAGHEIHVVLTLPVDMPSQDPPFFVHQVEAHGVRPLRIARRAARLRRTIASIAPEVTISFGYANNINCIPALAWNNIPHIVCERNNPIYDPAGWAARWVRRLLYPFASGFVFQTATIRDLFPSSVRRRSAVIPNPVIAPGKARNYENPAAGEMRVISVGRLSERDKNQSLLIRAFARLANEFPAWTLEFYGDGPDRSTLADLVVASGVSDRVRFCGRVDNPGDALERAEVFVLPSRTEGMPNALIEAMAAGVACLATDCSGGGAAALITHDLDGLLCANEDEDAVVGSLRRLMGDPLLRQALGKAATSIRETHSLERIGLEWLGIIRAQIS